MADREVDFLLVGGGMASAHCAATLRKRGADGSILLAGREKDVPYERPPLSKEYMRGESRREDAYVHAPEWYERQGVHTICPTRTAIDMLVSEVRSVASTSGNGARLRGAVDHEDADVG